MSKTLPNRIHAHLISEENKVRACLYFTVMKFPNCDASHKSQVVHLSFFYNCYIQ